MNALRERVVLAFVREYRAAVADGDRKTVLRAHPREAPLPWAPPTAAAAREAHR